MAANTNDFQASLPRVRRALLAWYARAGRRELPWRNTRDAYAIYISEIMLQQTQVKTVLDRYYAPFLKRFPTLGALADASVGEVVKQWEGLGYYTRARNLHAAAQQLVSFISPSTGEVDITMPGGGDEELIPSDIEALLALPGIGRNTAHAIACFGFGEPVPVMEANVKRVLCRVFAIRKPDDATLWEKATLLLDVKNAFDHNQAMMDIGALICTRRAPRCGECPLAPICKGKSTPEHYPQAKVSQSAPVRRRIIVAFSDGARHYYLARRDTRFLGGLYGFAEFEPDVRKVTFLGKSYVLKKANLLGGLTQTYSHFKLEAKVYGLVAKSKQTLPSGMVRASLAEISRFPLSRADHKVVRMLAESTA